MIDPPITAVEARILGALIEKQVTTPDNYPLSLNALVAACNQTSNREPIMQLDETTVSDAVTALRRRGLLRAIQPAGSRVTKFEHLLATAWNLDARELAVLCVLMLRGAQTPGELNTRTARLADFGEAASVEPTLDLLIYRQPDALVVRMDRRPGQKEARYAHLLGGEPVASETDATGVERAPGASDDRMSALEQTVDALRAEVAALRAELEEFRAQFR